MHGRDKPWHPASAQDDIASQIFRNAKFIPDGPQ
jgi:hypothetical protein